MSKYLCRQMASNGREWTRSLYFTTEEIPLKKKLSAPNSVVVSQSYQGKWPLTFEAMKDGDTIKCNDMAPDIGFRVVIEQLSQR